jgi:predicted DNA-binding antitoxin AbrB/MazE fold protein
MQKTFEAVYENGILRPLVPLPLADAEHVHVTIEDMDADVAAYFDSDEWETSLLDDVTLQDVRVALSSIQGSLSDAVIASRKERL